MFVPLVGSCAYNNWILLPCICLARGKVDPGALCTPPVRPWAPSDLRRNRRRLWQRQWRHLPRGAHFPRLAPKSAMLPGPIFLYNALKGLTFTELPFICSKGPNMVQVSLFFGSNISNSLEKLQKLCTLCKSEFN